MTTDPIPDGPFITWLKSQAHGKLLADIDREFKETIEDITDIGRGGSITIGVKFKPAMKSSNRALTVVGTVSSKRPEPDVPEQIWHATDAGALSDRDPRQPQLPNFGTPEPAE